MQHWASGHNPLCLNLKNAPVSVPLPSSFLTEAALAKDSPSPTPNVSCFDHLSPAAFSNRSHLQASLSGIKAWGKPDLLSKVIPSCCSVMPWEHFNFCHHWQINQGSAESCTEDTDVCSKAAMCPSPVPAPHSHPSVSCRECDCGH